MNFDLKKWLKALLFSTSEPLDIKQIQWVYNRVREERFGSQTETDSQESNASDNPEESRGEADNSYSSYPVLLTSSSIREAMNELGRELEQVDEVYRLLLTKEGYRLCIAPKYGEWVRALRGETKPLKLSQAALETLAIIAYRQPVTRSEIERIRGVSVDSALTKLVEFELVAVRGRAELPGRPLQYGTTSKFMDFCGIETLTDLPTSDIVSTDKLDEWVNRPLVDGEDGQESLDLKV